MWCPGEGEREVAGALKVAALSWIQGHATWRPKSERGAVVRNCPGAAVVIPFKEDRAVWNIREDFVKGITTVIELIRDQVVAVENTKCVTICVQARRCEVGSEREHETGPSIHRDLGLG
jgi:hypothetical protein